MDAFYRVYDLVFQKTARADLLLVYFTIILFFVTFLTVLIRSSPKADSSFVWTNFYNYTGWPDGFCFIAGLSTTCFMFGGLDASLHLAEEAENPRRSVPKAIIAAVCIGFSTAFPYTIAILYSITDLEAILTTTG